ncbi:MAG: hypothetical protein OEV87_11585 [Phycisphaerae bacterium]|nr:hypothetical protein [Phycisphaerae bacterium]
MSRNKKGEPVKKVIIKNPVAVSIVNARAQRDHLDAGTAAAVLIIETQNSQAKNPASFREGLIEK